MVDYTNPHWENETHHVHNESQTEHGVVVVFDVEAPKHYVAAHYMSQLLQRHVNPLFGDQSPYDAHKGYDARISVESWWFPEGPDKDIDGNDNEDMTLVSRSRLAHIVHAYDHGDIDGLEYAVELIRNQLGGNAL